jgi:hypothetical protein
MPEKLLKFLLDELQIIRVTCKSPVCGATVETTIKKAQEAFPCKCPVCGKDYVDGAITSPVSKLAAVLVQLAAMKKEVRIEFVLPDLAPIAEKKIEKDAD